MFRIEAFYVDDKNLPRFLQAVVGLVIDMQAPVPVVNAAKHGGKVLPATNGELVTMFMQHIAGQASTNAAQAKDFMQSIGKARSSYNYLLTRAVKYGVLKKTGKGSGMKYVVQDNIPFPAKLKPKGKRK